MTIRIHPLPAGLAIAFLIESPQGLYLVDSGSPRTGQVVLRKLRELGRSDLKLIFITHAHFDHYGSAAELRRQTGAPIAAHPADAQAMSLGLSPLGTTRAHGFLLRLSLPVALRLQPVEPTLCDIPMEDGETLERFGLDAYVLHTPGHTPGHCCLIVERNTAFVGDLISRQPRPGLQRLAATHWDLLSNSLAQLQAARPDWIYTGHGRTPLNWDQLQQIRSPKG